MAAKIEPGGRQACGVPVKFGRCGNSQVRGAYSSCFLGWLRSTRHRHDARGEARGVRPFNKRCVYLARPPGRNAAYLSTGRRPATPWRRSQVCASVRSSRQRRASWFWWRVVPARSLAALMSSIWLSQIQKKTVTLICSIRKPTQRFRIFIGTLRPPQRCICWERMYRRNQRREE